MVKKAPVKSIISQLYGSPFASLFSMAVMFSFVVSIVRVYLTYTDFFLVSQTDSRVRAGQGTAQILAIGPFSSGKNGKHDIF